MRASKTSGKNHSEEVVELRARVATLERMNRRLTRSIDPDESLDESWIEWERTFDATRDSIMILDSEFKIVQANLATSRVLGKPIEQIVGETCWRVVHGTEKPPEECPLRQALYSKNHEEAEIYVPEKNVWIEVSVDPVLDDQGNVKKAVHVIRDVTERRKTRKREKQYIRELEFLSESAAAFAQFPIGMDLYGYIAGRLKELVPGAIIAVNSYERESDSLRVRELLGLGGNTKAVIKLMGANPVGKCFEIDDQAREGLARGELEKVPGGIYDLSPGIPKAVCHAIEKLLGLGNVYGIGLSRNGELLGSIIILTRSRDELGNRSLIETFIKQAAVALQRAEAERAIQENEERLEAAIDAASLGIWDWDLTTGHIVWAGRHDKLLGFAPGEFDGRYKTVESRIHPDDVDGLKQAVERSLHERVDYTHEYRVMWPDGTMHWIASRGRYCWDRMGRPTRMLGVVSDVTDRKRAEEAYRSLVDHSLQGLAIFQDGRVVFANRAMAEITGYTVEEMLTLTFEKVQAFVHPDDREMVWDRHRRRMQGELPPEQYELCGIRKDGSIRWLAIDASTVEYQGRSAIQATYVDITESKTAKEALLKSEEELKAIFEGAVDGIVYADRRGYVIEVNPAFTEITGIPREQVVGKHGVNLAKQFAKPKDIPRLLRAISDALRGKSIILHELEINNKIVEIATPLLMKETIGITAVLRDVTDRKRAEDALRQSEKKFRSLFNNAEVGMFRSRLDGSEFLESNDKYLSILGRTREDVVGKPTVILWADHKDREEMVKILKDKGHVNSFECRLLNKAGEVINCLTSLRLYPETGILEGSIVDITERIKAEEKIKVFSDAINSAFDCFVLTDEKGNITYVNDSACRMFGYTNEEFLKLKVINLDADPTVAKKIIKEIAANGKWSGEVTNIRKNGETFPCLLSSFIIKDDKGIPKGTMGILRDITEHKKVVKALEESEQRFKTLFEYAPDAIYLNDMNGNFVDGNMAAEKMIGYKREELIGSNFAEAGLLSPEEIPKALAGFEKNINGESSGPDEFTLIHKDGNHVPVEIRTFPVRIGNEILALGIARDVTERKLTEDALRESEQQYRELFENAREAIVIIDMDKRITDANKFVEEYGFSKGDMTGRNYLDFVAEEYKEKAIEDFEKLRRGIPQEGEFNVITPKGIVTAYYRDNPIVRAGSVIYVQAVLTDITERKRAEDALRTSEARLSEAMKIAKLGYWEYDVADNVFIFNDQFYCVYRTSVEQVGGYRVSPSRYAELFLYPGDAPELGEEIRKAIETTDPNFSSRAEHRIIYGDGNIGYVSVRYFVVKDNQGRTIKTYGVNQDITDLKKAEYLMQKERDKAQKYLDVAAVMMIAVDSEQRVGLINKKGCEILGYTEEEILGKNWFDNFLPERFRNEVREVFEMFLRGQADAPEYFENSVLTRDGQERLIAWHNTTVRDEKGNFVAILSSGEDITEHKRTLNALVQSEEKYRNLFEHARDTIVTFDPKGNITDVNKAVEEYGFKREELMGKSLFDFVIEEHRAKAFEDFETLIGGRSVHSEMDVITPKGTVTVEYSDNPIMRGKDVVGVQAILTDITDRKGAERALRESEERYRSLFEGSLHPIAIYDRDANIVMLNDIGARNLKKPLHKILGRPLREFSPETHELTVKRVRQVLENGKPLSAEDEIFLPDGKRWFLSTLHPVLNSPKKSNLVQVISYDITERKQAEEKIARLAKLPAENPKAIVRISESGAVLYSNKASAPLLEAWECRERRRLPEYWYEFVLKALRYKQNQKTEVQCGGQIFSLTFAPVAEANYVNVYGHDITERKKAEGKLQEYHVKLKAMTSEILRTEERERKRIAIGLHDNICQNLVLTKVLLQSVLRLVSDASVSGPLKMACGAMSELIEQANSLTFELSNPILQELGFVMAMKKHLAEEIQQKYGIAFEFEGSERLRIPDEEIKNVLFRISRELLMNIVKHAQARNVKVSIHKRRSQIHLVIQDNGVGFDSKKVGLEIFRTSRFGLFSIREQLEHLGGTFAIESKPGRGTTATVVVPLGENTIG